MLLCFNQTGLVNVTLHVYIPPNFRHHVTAFKPVHSTCNLFLQAGTPSTRVSVGLVFFTAICSASFANRFSTTETNWITSRFNRIETNWSANRFSKIETDWTASRFSKIETDWTANSFSSRWTGPQTPSVHSRRTVPQTVSLKSKWS
jgi:hypothetical protein